MKKTNSLLLKVLDAEKSIIFFPVVELIPDELESLEEELNILGAKIILLNYSIKKKHEVLRGDLFKGEISDYMEKAVVLPGIDGFPLHVVLANVVEILLSDVVGRGKFTSIIWKSRGGSTNIDGRYFIPLKKYWLKKRELLCAIDFSDKKQKMIKELSQIEGFSKIYDSYLDAQNRKDGLVKEQNFGKAGTARDEEEKFWQELEYFTDKYANNFLKSFAQSVFAKSLNQ